MLARMLLIGWPVTLESKSVCCGFNAHCAHAMPGGFALGVNTCAGATEIISINVKRESTRENSPEAIRIITLLFCEVERLGSRNRIQVSAPKGRKEERAMEA